MRSKGLIDPQLDEEYPLPNSENILCNSDFNETTPFDDHDYSVSPTLVPPLLSPTTDVGEIDYRIHYSYRMLYLLKKVIILQTVL